MKKVVAGMDLHGNNVVIGVMDMDGKRVANRKVPCELKEVVKFLAPYKKRLEKVAVESTYNWYWLVDGLRALKYSVVLANPAGMQQYSGIKHADDTNDAFFLAELLRLNILPTGYIYDEQLRPVRDAGAPSERAPVKFQESLCAYDRPGNEPERTQRLGNQSGPGTLQSSSRSAHRWNAGWAY